MLHITRLKAVGLKGRRPALERDMQIMYRSVLKQQALYVLNLKTSTSPKSQLCGKQHKFVLGSLKTTHTHSFCVCRGLLEQSGGQTGEQGWGCKGHSWDVSSSFHLLGDALTYTV